MSLNLNKIKGLVSQVNDERKEALLEEQKKQNAKLQLEKERLEEQLRKKHQEVNGIIETLQDRIEKATKNGNRSLNFLWIDGKELLFKPRGFMFNSLVDVYLCRHDTKKTSIVRGYKPDCLPDYARKLFDYCKKNGLTTLFSTKQTIGSVGDTPSWRMSSYEIEIYW